MTNKDTASIDAAFTAAVAGDVETLFKLVAKDKSILLAMTEARFPLCIALLCNNPRKPAVHKAILQFAALEPGILRQTTRKGDTLALWFALLGHPAELVQLARVDPAILHQTDDGGNSVVMWLALDMHAPHLLELVALDPSVLTHRPLNGNPGSTSNTLAYWLGYKGHADAVRKLASKNPAVLTQIDRHGQTSEGQLNAGHLAYRKEHGLQP